MTSPLWAAVALSAVVALVSALGLRPLLSRLRMVDVPNDRSSHAKPTLRGGGLAPLLGFTLGGIWVSNSLPDDWALTTAAVTATAGFTAVVGLAEDLKGLSAGARIGLQLLAGGALVVVLPTSADIGWIWASAAAVGFAAHVNFTNFMDGVNGISSLHGLVAGLALAALGTLDGLAWLTVLGLIIAVVFIAFLPSNLSPPGIFLGDVGSYLLGGALGATAIATLLAGLNPVAVLAPFSIYWADTAVTLLRRAHHGEAVFQPHRSHVYQRLTDIGLSHLTVAVVVSAFTLCTSVVGLLAATASVAQPIAVGLIFALMLGYLALPRLGGDSLPTPISYALPPVALPSPSPVRSDWYPGRWAVLGCTGFIGSAMVKQLTTLGVEVLPLSAPRLELDPQTSEGEHLVALADDHPETETLRKVLAGVDVVINAAGMATPDERASEQLYGANSLLPAVIAVAAIRAGVGRMIHLSTAAVQGDRPVLDASADVTPFSPYSRSKALGEQAVLAVAGRTGCPVSSTDLVIVRGTSVQGLGRPTTESLRRLARSPLASVAAPGDQPTVVSSLAGLVDFIHQAGFATIAMPPIVLQPWEGMNVREVLQLAGDRDPVVLPAWLCRTAAKIGQSVGRVAPQVAGAVRRVELMWFGQAQEVPGPPMNQIKARGNLREVLAGRDSVDD